MTTACTYGLHRACPGKCWANDEATKRANYAGDKFRIICTCKCHKESGR